MTIAAGHTSRRIRFSKARAPVAIAMRAVAASVARDAHLAGIAPAARRSVFMRRAALGLDAPFMTETLLGTLGDKDLH